MTIEIGASTISGDLVFEKGATGACDTGFFQDTSTSFTGSETKTLTVATLSKAGYDSGVAWIRTGGTGVNGGPGIHATFNTSETQACSVEFSAYGHVYSRYGGNAVISGVLTNNMQIYSIWVNNTDKKIYLKVKNTSSSSRTISILVFYRVYQS